MLCKPEVAELAHDFLNVLIELTVRVGKPAGGVTQLTFDGGLRPGDIRSDAFPPVCLALAGFKPNQVRVRGTVVGN